jgi:hypothetical protein
MLMPDEPVDETANFMQAWRAANEAAARGIPTSYPMVPPPPAVGPPAIDAQAVMDACKARLEWLEASKNWPPK